MKKGKWTAEINVELEGVTYLLRELRPSARQRIFQSVGRGNLSGPLTAADFKGR